MPIKMTKELPNDRGSYFWAPPDNYHPVVGVYVDSHLFVKRAMGDFHVSEMGGYWAKVDKDQFEFVD